MWKLPTGGSSLISVLLVVVAGRFVASFGLVEGAAMKSCCCHHHSDPQLPSEVRGHWQWPVAVLLSGALVQLVRPN